MLLNAFKHSEALDVKGLQSSFEYVYPVI